MLPCVDIRNPFLSVRVAADPEKAGSVSARRLVDILLGKSSRPEIGPPVIRTISIPMIYAGTTDEMMHPNERLSHLPNSVDRRSRFCLQGGPFAAEQCSIAD